ncbi:MAG: prolipoprotein diacylglyceryl transferase [Treponema sp.]|nr:prolipoprotein diacylglyceryl transferase [Treponema sp.]
MFLLHINFPAWLKPEVIPGLPLRWYGLMYVAAFAVAFFVYRAQVRERHFPMSDDDLSGLFFWCILSLLLGARIFATLVYETSDIYRRQPWLIFWPFRDGKFTGLMGMSYHGGAIGGTLGIIIYSALRRWDTREIADMYACSIPLGYTFGRLGNFINGELYGRVTTGPLGMLFPHAARLPAGEAWVQEAAAKAGIPITGTMVNLPRHPSQLYEAFFEGIVCFAITWFLRNRKPYKGFLAGFYYILYSLSRFFIEYFREPDEGLGYRIDFVKNGLSPAISHPLLAFSTGQILSILEILFACVVLVAASRLPDREPIRDYALLAEAEKKSGAASDGDGRHERNSRRKLRRKLR